MNSVSRRFKLINSVAPIAATLALVIIESAVVLGSTQDFSVPDDVALRIRLDDTLPASIPKSETLSARLSLIAVIIETREFMATSRRLMHPANSQVIPA